MSLSGLAAAYSLEGKNVFDMILYVLWSIQTRGQDSAGVSMGGDDSIITYKGRGLVSNAIPREVYPLLRYPSLYAGIGHVKRGYKDYKHIEPVEIPNNVEISVGIDGRVLDRNLFEEFGAMSDAELVGRVFLRNLDQADFSEAEKKTMTQLYPCAGYAGVMLIHDDKETKLIAMNCPRGFRPISYGRVGDTYVVSSETRGLSVVGAEFIDDVRPGEMIIFSREGIKKGRVILANPRKSHCIFELVYYANPDSILWGRSVLEYRKRLGRKSHELYPVEDAVVISVPESGRGMSTGFAESYGSVVQEGLIKNVFVGRTFIMEEEEKKLVTPLKYNPVTAITEDAALVVTDDSIVTGNASEEVVKVLRERGKASEVHLRISSPPLVEHCILEDSGSMPFASAYRDKTLQQMNAISARKTGADSVGYMPLDELIEMSGFNRNELCLYCFTGESPFDR